MIAQRQGMGTNRMQLLTTYGTHTPQPPHYFPKNLPACSVAIAVPVGVMLASHIKVTETRFRRGMAALKCSAMQILVCKDFMCRTFNLLETGT